MPTTKVIDIINKARIILQDPDKVRWDDDELVGWLEDGQLAVVNRRPDANILSLAFKCIEGTKQSLPTDGIVLHRVIRNTLGKVVRSIPMDILDEILPNWHESVDSTCVEHFIYDSSNPKTFYLYPAPKADHSVDITYSSAPVIQAIDKTAPDVTISIDDAFSNALLDWVLYRAFSKDSDFTANAQRAAMHLDSFRAAIGDKTQADIAIAQAG